ncbi:MAG: hypothetical protein IKH27_02575 [Oscillospiraceae bacterium]|nr:hypothetical protein [Oscillospiraceae bacterium]
MNRKAILAAVLAAAMLTGMTGCGGNTGSSTADSSAAGDSAASEAADSAQNELPEVMPDDDFETDSAEPAESSDSEAPQDTPADAGSIAFDYVLNGTAIVVGEEAAPVLEKLGEAESVFEAPSCAFTGSSYYYTYGGVQVVTYPDEHDQSLNRLYEVDLNDSSAATNEGIKVGDSYDDLIAKYGTPTQETPAYASYQTEGKAVRFFLNGDSIKQIVYTIVM